MRTAEQIVDVLRDETDKAWARLVALREVQDVLMQAEISNPVLPPALAALEVDASEWLDVRQDNAREAAEAALLAWNTLKDVLQKVVEA